MQRYQLYIDGEYSNPDSNNWFESFYPFTGAPWALIPEGNAQDVDRDVRAAHQAFSAGPWPQLTASQRGLLLRCLGELVARDAKKLAELEARGNGKLIAEVQGQFDYIPQWYYYFGELADKIEGTVIPLDKKGYFNFTRNEPLGVVAAITPWNSSQSLGTYKIALAAGCTVVVKPSEFTSASTLEFVKLFEEAGLPRGVVNAGLGTEGRG
jgi:acyl-CoA reductase-like NAD-dependent aldehyde dehydrogenase